jgi:uncharacterized protein YoxC
MEQPTILTIMEVVALLCFSVLCVYLIVVMMRLQKIFGNIERDVREITSKASPILENLEGITGKFRNITDSISDDFEMLRYAMRSLRDAIESIVEFEQRVQHRIEQPVMDSVTTFTAFLKGVQTFFQYFRR